MRRHDSARALLTAVLVIAGTGMLHAISPASIRGQADEPGEQWEATDDIRLAVRLEQSIDVVLPGEKVEYIATIENRTGKPQSNLVVRVSVVSDGHAMTWVPDSTFIRYYEDRSEVSLRAPEAPPGGQSASLGQFMFANLAQSVAPDQTIQVRWSLQVDDCALRNRWVRVEITVLTDETESASDEAQIYVAPHTDLLAANHLTAAHSVDNRSPAPGEPVRHTISIVNEGFVKLDDLAVHFVPDLLPSETAIKFLRTVSEDALVYIAEEQGGEPGPVLPLDPKWINPEAGFRLGHLGPGEVLVLTWTDYIASDAPIGATIPATFRVDSGSVAKPWILATLLTVSSPRNLFINVETDDPGYLPTGYLPGDLVKMRVTVVNRAGMAHDNVSVTLDLPSAVSYIPSSGSYATPTHKGSDSRRLPDDWIYNGAILPTIESGDAITITFEVRVDGDVPPGSELHVYGTLRSTEADLTGEGRVDIAETPDIEITLAEREPVKAGGKTWFEVSVRNSGSVSVTGAKFGFEETCAAAYIPGSLWIESGNWVLRDDAPILEQLSRNEDISVALGDLDPDDIVRIRMQVQVANDVEAGPIAGPRLVVSGLRGEGHALPVAYARQAKIVVAEPVESFVTAEELEEATDSISPLGRGIGWFGEWAISGVLASFIAGLVLPFTLWRAARWLGSRLVLDSRDIALLMAIGLPEAARLGWSFVTARARRRIHGEPRGSGEEDEAGQ